MARGFIEREWQTPKGRVVSLQALDTQFVPTKLTPESKIKIATSASGEDYNINDHLSATFPIVATPSSDDVTISLNESYQCFLLHEV